MRKDRKTSRPAGKAPARQEPEVTIPMLEDEIEKAVDLLPQQEAAEGLLPSPPRPAPPALDEADPAMIDPAD